MSIEIIYSLCIILLIGIVITCINSKYKFATALSENMNNKHCCEHSLHRKQFSSEMLTSPIWPYTNRGPDYYDNYHGFANETQMHTNPLEFEYGWKKYNTLPY